ncbi:MAG: hypothetical protein KQJ78_04870 [Deltaproteobacteria bacterium]|nr:hypothetical protein [Deltaproteobacteria bacterium]
MGLLNLIKLALAGLALWLLYRGLRSLLMKDTPGRSRRSGGDPRAGRAERRPRPPELVEDLVQDPNCGTYIPRSEAIRTRVHGQEMFFCSERCRDEYLARGSAAAHNNQES